MSSAINEYILKKKRKKRKKKAFIISIFVLTIAVFVLTKASIFNVVEVKVVNNFIIPDENIIKTKGILNNNIFLTNLNDIKAKVLTHPYIESTKIKRELPNKIIVNVQERTVTFAVASQNKIYILNENLIIMEEREGLDGMSIPLVNGLDIDSKELGTYIISDISKREVLKSISEFLKNNNDIRVTNIDITNPNNIRLYIGELEVILGESKNINEKLIKAFKIIRDPNLNLKNGYINVSFNGKPVIFQNEEQVDENNKEEVE